MATRSKKDNESNPNLNMGPPIMGYEYGWKGKSNLHYSGRFMTGPLGIHALPSIGCVIGGLLVYIEVKELVVPELRVAGYDYLMTITEALSIFFIYHCIKIAITEPGVILRHSNYEQAKIKISQEEIQRRADRLNPRVPTVY